MAKHITLQERIDTASAQAHREAFVDVLKRLTNPQRRSRERLTDLENAYGILHRMEIRGIPLISKKK